MSQLYDRIIQQRGSLEKLVARIPGFKGYQENQARRSADTMLREYLARQIQQRVDRMVQIEKLVLDVLGLSYMSRTRDVKGKIQLYHDRVDSAMPGYSGMWAQMKIGSEELETIYAFDEAQMRYVDMLDDALERFREAVMNKDGVDAALMAVDDVATEANEAFKLRDDLLTRFSTSI